jgi:CrcB protein
MLWTLGQVALGGAIGSAARYLTSVAATRLMGHGFPWGTLTVNVLGSFLMGVLVVFLAEKGGQRFAPLLMVGILGGYTTFSAFSLDVITLFERGQIVTTALYAAATLVLTTGGIVAGFVLSRGLFQ